jgi:anti-sigma regulatory factor (Ser/Thr protein kinase)
VSDENAFEFAVFRGEPRSVQAARDWAAACLAQAEADPEIAALLASELVTNAVIHSLSGEPGGTVTVVVTACRVLHVHDHGPREGSCRQGGWTPGEDRADFGRGLLLVAELATGLEHSPAAECPVAWPNDLAVAAGGCCTRCVAPALADAVSLEGQPAAAAA